MTFSEVPGPDVQDRAGHIRRRSILGPPPASFAQEELWLFESLRPGTPAYIMSVVVRLTGALDVVILSQALNEILRRHESLRTTFAAGATGPVQIINSPSPAVVEIDRVAKVPVDELGRHELLRECAVGASAQPFNLSCGPLLRVRILELDSHDRALLVTMHHAVADAHSVNLFLLELETLYRDLRAGQPPSAPDLPIQYADFAVWQRDRMGQPWAERELAYWKHQLSGAPPLLEIPTDRPRGAVQRLRAAHQDVSLPQSLVLAARALARAEGCTGFVILLAAFFVLLWRYSGQRDVVVGSPLDGRIHDDLKSLIGLFVNVVALRVELSGHLTFRDVVQRTHQTVLAARAHQELPFQRVVRALAPGRSLSHAPLVQVVFGKVRSMPSSTTPDGELTFTRMRIGPSAAGWTTLWVSMTDAGDNVTGRWGYDSDLFNRATVTRMAGHYEELLRCAIQDPERRITNLTMLSAGERTGLVPQ